jgi:DNA polymerase elongation subunit (family B)
MSMIRILSTASNSKDFIQKIPAALNMVKEYRRKLIQGEVSIWDLIVTKHLSKELEEYKQKVSQLIAAEQLLKKGVKVPAGKNIRFLFTSAENKQYNRRVRAEELTEDRTNADVKKYLQLLYSAASTILSTFGYSTKEIYDSIRGHHPTKLTHFSNTCEQKL